MEYIIKQNEQNKYICYDELGRLSLVNRPEKASRFTSSSKAWKVITTQMPKRDRTKWGVVELPKKSYNLDKNIIGSVYEEFDWGQINQCATEIFKLLVDYKERLTDKLSHIGAELCDCEHACEFFDLDDERGYKLFKMMHERRVKRRFLKNELRKVSLILGMSYEDIAAGRITDAIKMVDEQVYEPRVLAWLFNNNTDENPIG